MINKVNRSSRKYGKNRKAGWRRNIDLDDIDELLQAQRKDTILDGAVADKTTSDLLVLDTSPDTDINENNKTSKSTEEISIIEINNDETVTLKFTDIKDDKNGTECLSNNENKLKAIKKKHMTHAEIMKKCYPLIDGMPGAKCPPTRSQATTPQGGYEVHFINKKYKARRPPKHLESIKQNIEKHKQHKLTKPTSNRIKNYNFDLWAEEEPEKETFMKEVKEHYMTETKKKPHVIPKSAREKTSLLPSVPTPHPGVSYNPTFADHQNLLGQALKQESARLKKEARIDEKFYRYLPTRSNAPTPMTWVHEMSEGLPEEDDKKKKEEEVEEEKDEDELYTKVMLKAKSSAKRKKKKEKRAVGITKFREKVQLFRESKINNIDEYVTEIKTRQEMIKRRAEKRAIAKEQEPFKVKRISKGRFQDEDIVVNMEDELTENLLGVTPAKSLLLEHFTHMQRRNMVHSRHNEKKRRKMKKKKPQIKRSFRIDEDDMNSIKKLNN